MLAAVAAALYFEDMAIRISSGAIFVVGAVLLYVLLSKTELSDEEGVKDGDAGEDSGTEGQKRGAIEGSVSDADSRRSQHGPAGTQQRGTRQQRSDHGNAEIPPELYRAESDAAAAGDPRSEFDALTSRLLHVLKDYLFAHTVALFWINQSRGQIVFGEFTTESRNFTTARRIALGTDLVSLVGTSGQPRILSEINAASEQDLVVYYDAKEGIQSFVGVPVFFMDEPIAVIVADSKAPDSFGVETVGMIGKFTALLVLLLQSYNQKFDLASDSRLLGVLNSFRKQVRMNMDTYGVSSALVQAAADTLDWDFIVVVLRNPQTKNWVVARSRSKAASLAYVSEGVTVDMDGSVLREVLEAQEGRILQAPVSPQFRFHPKETIESAGQLCVVPVSTATQVQGLVVVEYREDHQYGQRDLKALEQIASLAGLYLETTHIRELAARYLMVDESTQTASRPLLLQRLSEEHGRIESFGGHAVFLLVSVDTPDDVLAKHGAEGLDLVLSHIGRLLKSNLHHYDVVGRFDSARFGLLQLHVDAEEAYLRSEKLRKLIAGNIVNYGGVSFSVTVSIAGCLLGQGMDVDQILKLSRQAIDRAVADGGNCVKVV
jgi:diguanylate cyclase (GGDEF)-like protein